MNDRDDRDDLEPRGQPSQRGHASQGGHRDHRGVAAPAGGLRLVGGSGRGRAGSLLRRAPAAPADSAEPAAGGSRTALEALPLPIPLQIGPPDAGRRRRLEQVLREIEEAGPAAVARRWAPRLTTYEALMRWSWALRYRSVRDMRKLAELAAALAAGLSAERYGVARVHDLRCFALLELANALRAGQNPADGRRAFDEALQHFAAGSHSPLLAARLAAIEGHLLAHQRSFAGAWAAFDSAADAYRRQGLPHQVGSVLINKGLYASYLNRPREATELLREAATLVDPEADPALSWVVRHNLSHALVLSGRYREARQVVWRTESLYDRHRGLHGQRTLRWLQARIHAGLHEDGPAIAAFDDARQAMLASGEPYSAACITLELCGSLSRAGGGGAGGHQRARALAEGAADLLLGQEVSRGIAVAMLLLKTSLRFGVESEELSYDRLAAFVAAAEHDPAITLDDFVQR
jgi:tetratricopeptide (TPR) repeat protein